MFQMKQEFEKCQKVSLRRYTNLNLNRGRSGKRRTARSEENIVNFSQLLHDDAHVTGRRNLLQISRVTFQRICKLNIKWHPCKIFKRHVLLPTDLSRKLQFCHWLLDQGERYLDNFVIRDEAAFCLNGSVNTQNVR